MNNLANKIGRGRLSQSFILLECFIWGVGNPITKIGLETIPPFYCLAIRFALAFFLFLALFGPRIRRELRRDQLPALLTISLFSAAAFIFSTVALLFTTATTAGFLMGLSVVFTPLFSFLILRRKPRPSLFAVIAAVVLGMYLLCVNSGSFTFGPGEVLALLCSVTFAAALTYSAKYVRGVGPLTLSTFQAGAAAVCSLLFALFLEDPAQLAGVAPAGWGATLYLAVACTFVAYLLQNYALQHVSAVFASLAFCMEPIFTAAASFILLGETLSLFGIAGAALITFGTAAAAVMPTTQAAPEKTPPPRPRAAAARIKG